VLPKFGTRPGERLAARGANVNRSNPRHELLLLCSRRAEHCEKCPRLDAVRERALIGGYRIAGEVALPKNSAQETNVIYGNRKRAEITNAHAQPLLTFYCRERGVDCDGNPVFVEVMNGVDEAKSKAKDASDRANYGNPEGYAI
jgi:hypothetical protein